MRGLVFAVTRGDISGRAAALELTLPEALGWLVQMLETAEAVGKS